MAAVALHSTAEVPRFRQGACARKDRHAPGVDSDSGAGGENHLRRMAEKAEAGDVGRAGGAKIAGHLGRDAIEPAHASDGAREHLVARHAILPRGGDDAGAERLGEKKPIAWPET